MSTQNQNTNNGGNPNLAGKVAVVTGASKGIGAATAKRLAAAGAAVVVNYATSKADADKVVAEIVAQGGRAVAVQGDVSKRADATSIIEAAVEKFGRLDILVNNSGIYKLLPLADLKEEDFHRHFNVNVLGVLLTTQAALKHLPEGGSIVNISSGVTTIVPANSAVYTGTKGALDAITGVLSRELGPKKIRVNSVNPGVIQTEGTVTAGVIGSEFETWAVNNTPLGRIGQPDDIADIVVFLASDASPLAHTGEQLLATGGHALIHVPTRGTWTFFQRPGFRFPGAPVSDPAAKREKPAAQFRQVLECASPLALLRCASIFRQSGGGPPQSKSWRIFPCVSRLRSVLEHLSGALVLVYSELRVRLRSVEVIMNNLDAMDGCNSSALCV